MSYAINGNQLVLTVTMRGNVKFCGMEGSITVPTGLTYVSALDGDGTVSNYSNGVVYFMFSSANGRDVTSTTTITKLTFTISDTNLTSVTFDGVISDIYDQNYTDMEKSIIGETVKLK